VKIATGVLLESEMKSKGEQFKIQEELLGHSPWKLSHIPKLQHTKDDGFEMEKISEQMLDMSVPYSCCFTLSQLKTND
jgi:hypothetical protein